MIIVIGGTKGGSGKTTVATNLAVLRSADKDVLLVDADDQETATDFTMLRNETRENGAEYTSVRLAGSAVRTEIQRLESKYDDIIIDVGGRDTTSQRAALTIAKILLVPFVPRSFDVWTLEKVSALVTEVQLINPALEAFIFLNRTDHQGSRNEEAAGMLRDTDVLTFIAPSLGTRTAFGDASAQGLAVTELKPPNHKASEEIITLYKYIYSI